MKRILLLALLIPLSAYAYEWEICNSTPPAMNRLRTPEGWISCISNNYFSYYCTYVQDKKHSWDCRLLPATEEEKEDSPKYEKMGFFFSGRKARNRVLLTGV